MTIKWKKSEIDSRVPTAQGNQGKWQINSLAEKTQGTLKFCKTGKIYGILPKHRENTGNFV